MGIGGGGALFSEPPNYANLKEISFQYFFLLRLSGEFWEGLEYDELPFSGILWECISAGSIRAISGLRLPFLMMFFVIYLQKTVHFYTLFQNTLFPWEKRQTG